VLFLGCKSLLVVFHALLWGLVDYLDLLCFFELLYLEQILLVFIDELLGSSLFLKVLCFLCFERDHFSLESLGPGIRSDSLSLELRYLKEALLCMLC